MMASSAAPGSAFVTLETERTAGSSGRVSSRGLRFGSLSHHSFFSRHNPHPHRVRHMQGLNGKPVCTVNDEWFAFTPLCPHPLIKSQVYLNAIQTPGCQTRGMGTDCSKPAAALTSESWREELKDLASKVSALTGVESQVDKREKVLDEDLLCRQTQYSSQTGRIIPNTSWGSKRRRSHLSLRQTGPQRLDGMEIKVLELLCQILQTDSLSMVQQWLLLASNKEKQLVQGLLSQAMGELNINAHSSSTHLLPLTAEDLIQQRLLESRFTERQKRSSQSAESVVDEPERLGEAEVFTVCPEETS